MMCDNDGDSYCRWMFSYDADALRREAEIKRDALADHSLSTPPIHFPHPIIHLQARAVEFLILQLLNILNHGTCFTESRGY